MIESAFGLEIIAICLIFLMSSVWSEENVRFGYVLVPLMTAFFWWAGFLPFSYLPTVVPLLVFMGIISYMRSHLKVKWGFFGTSSGILYKLVFFLIMMQVAIGYINGIGLFSGNMALTPENKYTTYDLASANDTFAPMSSGLDVVDTVTNGLHLGWILFTILWSMLSAVFFIYPTLVSTFGIPPSLSILLQTGIYIIYALELINMVFKPYKAAEV